MLSDPVTSYLIILKIKELLLTIINIIIMESIIPTPME